MPPEGSQGGYWHENRSLYGVAFGNSTFVAVGQYGKIVRSINSGASWISVSQGYSPYYPYGSDNFRGVTFGNNTFVAVGDDGRIIRSTDDGSSWDNKTAVNDNNLYGVTFGNNTFVAVGESGTVITSGNGTSWSEKSPGGATLWSVTFGNNIFMAVGNGGRIIKSTDNGANWSASPSRTENHLYGVAFGD